MVPPDDDLGLFHHHGSQLCICNGLARNEEILLDQADEFREIKKQDDTLRTSQCSLPVIFWKC